MLFRQESLEGIRAGSVTLAFRRWLRQRVRAGTRLRTSIGLVEVISVEPVDPAAISADEAQRAGFASPAALTAELGLTKAGGAVYRIELAAAGEDPRIALRADANLSRVDVERISARLARMDESSRHGPWTGEVLAMIEAEPGRRAPDLAVRAGRATLAFKADVRKLKEMGLTESLEIGYRLSPRGEAYMAALRSVRQP